ncbi:SRPBCC family protein [Flavobacterium weaverense]|uniref:Polyketide cyclase/dehydrase/lipid transport protein n=1 Tax=Flavobacterium weaverense TaxID=271156 RepID=A0A3M0A148_9FLAO|nr:SRPBCC family protein [Flavobacterium weaverense]RMA78317.1 polyketide cyclase/dehydrase/lipid transport protein [Flavobacterium weaverense]
MRILKYLFLLLLLTVVALSIFVATQKGDFTVERSQIINSPKSNVYSFVNDFRNWEDFSSWMTEDPEIKINYPAKTIGAGASFSWKGKDGAGDVKTIFVKENDSISQKMNCDGTSSSVFWSFKDTIGGTKVTWKTTGKMDFSMKVYTAFNGGIYRIFGKMYEKSLANLDKTLDYEINTYNVKVDGIVKFPATFYLEQTFTSKISNVNKNSRIVFKKITHFCNTNNIELNGKPFLIYHNYDLANGLTRLSFCVPIKSQILTSSGSDILSGKIEEFEAVKTTLTGDYSHSKKTLDKATNYINANRILVDQSFTFLQVYKVTKADIKSPSKWVTEMYYPIQPKVAAVVPNYVPAQIKKVEPVKVPVVPTNKEEEQSEF